MRYISTNNGVVMWQLSTDVFAARSQDELLRRNEILSVRFVPNVC